MRNRYKFFADIGGDTIEFPVNPKEYTIAYPTNHKTYNILDIGEVIGSQVTLTDGGILGKLLSGKLERPIYHRT